MSDLHPCFPTPESSIPSGAPVHTLGLKSHCHDGRHVVAKPSWLEPYHEPGDYASLSELLRGVVPAGKVSA